MNARDRRKLIEQQVVRTGEVQFSVLAEEFGVSEMTVRRDIDTLERQGVVRRVSGGAIPVSAAAFEPSYGLRNDLAAASKDHIATAMAGLLRPGETVVLDSGSTVARVAHAIRGRGLGLTVITPSLPVATALADEPGTHVILTGGTVRPGELSLVGHDAERAFERFNCDTFVIGVAGVDADKGLTEYHPGEASVKRAALAASSRLLVGADAAKLGRVHLVNIAPITAVGVLVTDAAPDHPTVEAARAAGAEVVLTSRDVGERTGESV
ncbi:DeoR/GlpR family DNA-binding transcription regulator [Actinocorallia sp. A-T 12471]|uniref:DeoR/GlpR family DNA-binding transcription regulator n=1 Tax=Actinocorallia sp. A-T 12471 TaxID=3089813 RepID=UPI0029CC9A5B|nr:DeoR/GlpR family DNA-binding transcription regulator [Actinocorallia sp. A-T 12471]MDX6744193.1 DeoR/GlpR family DNA-binding transcription regulator [Actinocorallia sp. A-T 12471]